MKSFAVTFTLVMLAQSLPRTSRAGETTRTFQQGLDGYAGAKDSYVSTEAWANPPQYTLNYGAARELVLLRNGQDNPLLRFDLGAITSNSAVTSATLWLYNTTSSSSSGTRNFSRVIALHRVLRDWDEGNQDGSAIDLPGDRGATGDNAFTFYPGEGANLPWAARGLAGGDDFQTLPGSQTGVVNEGWYAWDLTALVQSWVRGELPNFGIVLRDTTGYQDDHRDFRNFVSGQGLDAALRPRLVVVYNPDTPSANAGPDLEDLHWNGSALTLDGSASQDRPGGNNATLAYAWRVLTAANGSTLAGQIVGASQVSSFTPDAAGDYEIELAVTNDTGETATDRMVVRIWSVRPHPRIYLTPARWASLQSQAVNGNPRWERLLAEASAPGGDMLAKAFVGALTGQSSLQDEAIAAALNLTVAGPNNRIERHRDEPGRVALVYDWCWGRLTPLQKSAFIAYFNYWGPLHTLPDVTSPDDVPGWHNFQPRFALSYALMGLATLDENPSAGQWLAEFRDARFEQAERPVLDRIAAGGSWPEGTVYDSVANLSRALAAAAWHSGTGEDLFLSTAWYRNRFPYLLMVRYPGVAVDQSAYVYHPAPSIGDAERDRGSIAGLERMMGLVLLDRFPDAPAARQYQAYVAALPSDSNDSYWPLDEFLWFHPERPSEPPALRTHYSEGTGTVMIRSGWPSGAADTNPWATHIRFQCGDHFTYHQHLDQNSFTLFKGEDLAIDSGVYSGEALSWHDVNYYTRTIAHNTLLVYNPLESFSAARPDAVSNDGGQRSFTPATLTPPSVEYWETHREKYDTGTIPRFEDHPRHVYALGDATMAYNNPVYNQAMNGVLVNNIAKVSGFQREFVYLRATPDLVPAATNDFVVIFDRVGVTQPSFSGQNTKLLFHTLAEPTVTGTPTPVSAGETVFNQADEAVSDIGSARLFMRFLLPAQRNVRKVGGRGVKAFWVFNANYDWHWADTEPQPRPFSDFEFEPYGEWRLELEPADNELNHNFLTVLQPTVTNTAAAFPTTLLQTGGMSGVYIADPLVGRIVMFSGATNGAPPVEQLTYACAGSWVTLHTILDLSPGSRYTLASSRAGGVRTFNLAPDPDGSLEASSQGVLTFLIDDRHRVEALSLLADGRIRFEIAGPSDLSCFLQSAPDLTGDWTDIASFANVIFPVGYTNTPTVSERRLFFRLRLPNP